jgi:PAS domain-containing protein
MTDEGLAIRVGGWPAGPNAEPSIVLTSLTAALFDRNPDLVWDFDLDGRVRRVNPRIQAVLGYDPADAVGWRVADLVVPEDLPSGPRGVRRGAGGAAGHVHLPACATRTAAWWWCGPRSSRSWWTARSRPSTPAVAT